MHILNFKGYEQECQIIIINKPQISVAFNLFTMSIISVIFCKKVIFEVSTFGGWLLSGGPLLSGFANTCDILSLFSKVQSCWTYAISRQGIELIVTLFSSYQAPGGIA